MKKIFLAIIALSIFTVSCKESKADENISNTKESEKTEFVTGKAIMTFEETEHDFGQIKEGETVETTMKFTNTGTEDLIIKKAKGTCGCTIPSYPKTPIKPGESGELNVKFNSSGKKGMNTKIVTISVNTANGYEMIKIKANVEPKQ